VDSTLALGQETVRFGRSLETVSPQQEGLVRIQLTKMYWRKAKREISGNI
jgi:hypothetical protein